MEKIYSNYLESHFLKLNPPTKKSFQNAAKQYRRWYGKTLSQYKNTRILDIGCGMGHFLYFLKTQGFSNFLGIDTSKQQVDFVKKNITKNVLHIDAFNFLKNKEKSFNVVVLNDVLEHIPKIKLIKFLELVYDFLEIEGIIIIKVPNMSNPFGLMSRYMDITHEIGFTEESLSEVLKSIGFKNIEIVEASSSMSTVRSLIRNLSQRALFFLFRKLFLIQEYSVPKILNRNIIAIAKKIKPRPLNRASNSVKKL